MGETPWTKGPWEVERSSGRANLYKGGVRVATVYPCNDGVSAVGHANRFAASEAMADLLARILPVLEAEQENRGGQLPMGELPYWTERGALASETSALLARVKGEQPQEKES
jgi:hypothetical protein